MKVVNILSIFTVATTLVACGSDNTATGNNAQVSKSVHQNHKPYPGKPGAPVELEYTINGRQTQGNSVTVEINLTPSSNSDSLNITVNSTQGLTLQSNISSFNFTSTEAGVTINQPVDIMIDQAGSHFVNILVTMGNDGHTSSRSFSIPVITEGQSIQKLNTDNTGTRVHSLEETRAVNQ